VPLVYLRDGDILVVVASNGGNDRHPDWFINLVRDPRAEVQIAGRKVTVAAVQAAKGDRERLWAKVVRLWPGYARYQQATKRLIPLVMLREGPGVSGDAFEDSEEAVEVEASAEDV
jgi:deazaflavin-dependent oxidoreductase (nitroreductase family)